ncbi:MAG: sulfatase-like hydrolase/transferase [Helicobacteraceae bacterium]|nr:sulfatase-like hydrolase/transferase [Helicobacteraceae bacterium]
MGSIKAKILAGLSAGTTGYLCAIPLNLPRGINLFINNTFLESATCISDVLNELGYNQRAILGYDFNFVGSRYLFASHNIEAYDLNYFRNELEIESGFWGIKDAQVLNLAKKFLSNYDFKAPFALYLSTVDTHGPKGFLDKVYCPNLEYGLNGAIECGNRILNDFISWIKTQEFYKDTTIIIVGDHLAWGVGDMENRFIYNVFINPSFSKIPGADLIKNRKLSHFDISALILDSLNIPTQYFGLGRNPLYQKTLLEIYGIDEFNKQISSDSRFYESLWR